MSGRTSASSQRLAVGRESLSDERVWPQHPNRSLILQRPVGLGSPQLRRTGYRQGQRKDDSAAPLASIILRTPEMTALFAAAHKIEYSVDRKPLNYFLR